MGSDDGLFWISLNGPPQLNLSAHPGTFRYPVYGGYFGGLQSQNVTKISLFSIINESALFKPYCESFQSILKKKLSLCTVDEQI